ncbi:MAG: hypothetical protein KDI79_21245 [Anaerolineae bacterium]|nr:hypothetical protein [Anaerolineae bacterium]
MSTFLIFVAGVLVGWLIEWAVDWLYWRRVNADMQSKLAASEALLAQRKDNDTVKVEALRRELAQAKAEVARHEQMAATALPQDQYTAAQAALSQCQQELTETRTELNHYLETFTEMQTYRDKLAAAEAEIDRLKTELTNRPGHVTQVVEKVIIKDNLERINGIGPVFARRFNKADIFTFDQLAALTPERIQEIIVPQPWQHIDPEEWIAEAKEFAESAGQTV